MSDSEMEDGEMEYLKTSKYAETIDKLFATAAKCEESEFQKNKDYKKFKANKNIKPKPDIDFVLMALTWLFFLSHTK